MSVAPSLSYATGNTPRPTGRRFVVCLRVTGWVMLVLAFLLAWNIFSYFGVTHHRVAGPAWMSPRISSVTLEMDWKALWKALPVLAILSGFAGAYWLLSRRARRGSETAIFAAGVMSMILTLVSALWVLTLFVYGAINVDDAKLWWERVLSLGMIFVSMGVLPWLAYVTILGFDQMRYPRLKPVTAAQAEDSPVASPEREEEESAGEDAAK
jgi:hypothetical protein